MLVVARHGRTGWNAEGRFQGWADIPLDPVGREQSVRLAAALREKMASPCRVQVASSDLRRAVETARTVAAALGAELTVEPDLREVDVGGWEGLTRSEAQERFPSEWREWAAGRDVRSEDARGEGVRREDVRRGGGETLAEAGARVGGCIEGLLAAAGHSSLVVVGHGMSLRAALAVLARRGVVALDVPPPHLGNAEFLVVEDQPAVWRSEASI